MGVRSNVAKSKSYRKPWSSLFLLLFVFSFLSTSANDLEAAEQELVQLLKELQEEPLKKGWDELNNEIGEALEKALLLPNSMKHSFALLQKRMIIRVAEDRKVRTFSWNRNTGGTWHSYGVYAQYLKSDGTTGAVSLSDGNEGRDGGYTDSYIYGIHKLLSPQANQYLLLGSGTHGSGNHHAIARVFILEQDQLLENSAAFEHVEPPYVNLPYYVIETRRSSKIRLRFDSQYQTLSYPCNLPNEEGWTIYCDVGVIKIQYDGKMKRFERIQPPLKRE